MDTGVAARPIKDFDAYKEKLKQFYIQSQLVIRPIYEKAQAEPKRVAFAEGEEDRVLRAVQIILDDKIAKPVLVGRKRVIQARIKKMGLRIDLDKDVTIVDPENDPRYADYWQTYHTIMERKGVTPAVARTVLRTDSTAIAALLMHKDDADALICGTVGEYQRHLEHIKSIIGLKPGVETPAALVGMLTDKGTLFISDTHVNPVPSVCQIMEMTLLASEQIRRFGIEPKVALLSHSNFGTREELEAQKMRTALAEIKKRDPELMIDGEMHADTALSASIREEIMPNCKLDGNANLLIMPDVQSANITYNALKVMTDAVTIGPLLLGVARPAHILTQAVTTRGIVNVAALACVEAQIYAAENKQKKML